MNVVIILSALAHFNTQLEEKYCMLTTKEEEQTDRQGLTWPLTSVALKHPLFTKCIKGRICITQLPFPFNIYENAIYCMSDEKCSFRRHWQQVLVKWSGTICHWVPTLICSEINCILGEWYELRGLDMFLLICIGYMHVFLFVGKQCHK